MSYSFSAQGATKTDAILDAEAKFDKVCRDMPVHEKDKDVVLSHMRNCVNIAREPQADEHIYITMSGYMSVHNPTGEGVSSVDLINACCSVSIARPMPGGAVRT